MGTPDNWYGRRKVRGAMLDARRRSIHYKRMVGRKLRRLREAAGLLQKDVAEATGRSEPLISVWETSHRTRPRYPPREVWPILCELYQWPDPETLLEPEEIDIEERRRDLGCYSLEPQVLAIRQQTYGQDYQD